MKTIVMCPPCSEMLVKAGYKIREKEPCEKREKCFWCHNRGYFSVYITGRDEDAEQERM